MFNMTIILIQVRVGSTRLPGKSLKLLEKVKMINYVLDSAMKSKYSAISGIIFPECDKKIFDKYKDICFCYSGSEFDVLERYYKAMKFIEREMANKVLNVVRLTSDCPLLYYIPRIIDKVIYKHLKDKNDFTHNRGSSCFPSGLDVEIMTRKTLEKCYKEAIEKIDREHVTSYIKENQNDFKIGNVECPIIFDKKLSVDTQEDFDYIHNIIKLFNLKNEMRL